MHRNYSELLGFLISPVNEVAIHCSWSHSDKSTRGKSIEPTVRAADRYDRP